MSSIAINDGAVLIVGAGQSGFQLAAALRTGGHTGPISLVGEEPFLPYQRPPLSKGVGFTGSDEELAFRPPAFYDAERIRLITSDPVEEIDLARSSATTQTGQRIAFDHLAFTTGSRPRRLAVPGAEAAGVVYLRTLTDGRALGERAASAKTVVVIGGGYVGLEVAAAVREAGMSVTVVDQGRLLSRTASPMLSDYLLTAHTKRGIRFELGRTVAHVDEQNGRARGVVLDDGRYLDADMVVVGIGAEPAVALAEKAGLEITDGAILVDEFARTSHPSVVAAGDVTAVRRTDRKDGGFRRLESVQNAVEQAKVAASTILGKLVPYEAVPWFWSDQADLKLKTAGLFGDYDDIVIKGDMATDRFAILCYRAGNLISVEAINSPADYMAGRRELARVTTSDRKAS